MSSARTGEFYQRRAAADQASADAHEKARKEFRKLVKRGRIEEVASLMRNAPGTFVIPVRVHESGLTRAQRRQMKRGARRKGNQR